jgi:hypothetical protein
MNLNDYRELVLAQREEQRKANLAKSEAFLATLAKSLENKEGK